MNVARGESEAGALGTAKKKAKVKKTNRNKTNSFVERGTIDFFITGFLPKTGDLSQADS
jgi:hypothetical protein